MAPNGPSQRTTPDEFLARLKDIVADNIAGSTRLVTRFSDLLHKASQAAGAGRGEMRSNTEPLLSQWIAFSLRSYEIVNRQSLALLNDLLVAAENALDPMAPTEPDARGPRSPWVELRLSGRPGERAATGFVIENRFNRPLALTFEPTDLVPGAGATLPASLVSFEPPTLAIEPYGQGVVQATVAITSDFVIGQTYTTTIRLVGFEAKDVVLLVTVLPPVAQTDTTTTPPTPAKKKRSRAPKSRKPAAPSSSPSKPKTSSGKKRSRSPRSKETPARPAPTAKTRKSAKKRRRAKP